jgi:hypothetical protein
MKVPIKHKRLGIFWMEIDDEDWDKIKHLNLTLNYTSNPHTKYCKSIVYEKQKYIKTINIHRLILGLGDFKNDKRMVNHKDGNGLNNKKSNLEISNAKHNSQSFRQPNRKCENISFEKNTEKIKRKKQWRFIIVVNGKKHRKRFLTKEEAIEYKEEFLKNIKK